VVRGQQDKTAANRVWLRLSGLWLAVTGEKILVELVGLEPTASSLRMTASPNQPRAGRGLLQPARSITFQPAKIQRSKNVKFQVCRESCLNSFSGLHPHGCGRDILFSSTRPQRGVYLRLHLKRCS
jgi:hypothetical protein